MPTPEISDYPPLLEWLNKHDAKCLWYVSDWERGVKKPLRHVEAWLVRGALVLVVLYAERRGWHIYTEANTTDIAAQFADVERRIRISAEEFVDTERDRQFTAWAANKSAVEIRDAIIQQAGMMASARTPAMQAAYEAALAREGKVDSPDGPCNPGRVSFTEQREDRREAVRKAINGRVILDGPLSNKVLDEIISAVLHN